MPGLAQRTGFDLYLPLRPGPGFGFHPAPRPRQVMSHAGRRPIVMIDILFPI